MSILIELLSTEDVANMSVIAQKAHLYPMSKKTIETCFGKFYRNLGLKKEGKLQGFTILYQVFEEATLIDICLLPSMQNQGLAKKLLIESIEQLKKNGAETLLLEVRASNQVAIGLYKKLGFMTTGVRKGYYPSELGFEDAVLMSLDLVDA